MTEPNQLTGREANVQRLRELHLYAEDADRPQAALLLALAISDLTAYLPDDDLRLPELAREGLLRLDESAATSAAVAQSRHLLRQHLPTTPTQPTDAEPQAETLSLGAANLAWNVDWDALRSAMTGVRNFMEAMRFLEPILPEQLQVVWQNFARLSDVINASESGQWKPEHDETLANLSQLEAEVEATGLGRGLEVFLRLISMMVRIERCRSIDSRGGTTDWPALVELDKLIADLELEDPLQGFGPPFDALIGIHRFYAGVLLLTRFWLDIRGGVGRRDRAWFDSTIRLLRRAQDHLAEAPPAFAGGIRPMLVQIDAFIAALNQTPKAAGRTTQDTGEPPAAAPEQSAEPPDNPADVPIPQAEPTSPAARVADRIHPLSMFDRSASLLPRQVMEGLRIILQAMPADHPPSIALSIMTHVMDAVYDNRWTSEQDHALEGLQQAANRLADQDGSDRSDAVMIRAALAAARGIRWQRLSESPQPEDRLPVAELPSIVAELESVLGLLPQAGRLQAALPLHEMAGLLHGLAGMLLASLARQDAGDDSGSDQLFCEDSASLLTRARDHLAKVPPELADLIPAIRDHIMLDQVLGGDVPARSQETERDAERIADVYADSFDASGGGLARARAATEHARQTRDPIDVASAISELRAVGRGLPAGHPEHATVLIWLAELLGIQAMRARSSQSLADAVDATITAVRVAPQRAALKAATERLASLLCIMMIEDQRSGPFLQAEEALSTALAATSTDDCWLLVTLTVGIGAARNMRARVSKDEALYQLARQAITDAEQMLPEVEPTDQWFDAGRLVFMWTTLEALKHHDAEAAAVALRMVDKLEGVLVSNPGMVERVSGRYDQSASLDLGTDGPGELQGLRLARELLLSVLGNGVVAAAWLKSAKFFGATPTAAPSGTPDPALLPSNKETGWLVRRGLDQAARVLSTDHPGGLARRPLSPTDRPQPESLRAACADLHAALASDMDDTDLRHRANATLGVCLAELYWLGEPDSWTAISRCAEQGSNPAGSNDDYGIRPGTALTSTLVDAIEHLNRSLTTSKHTLPTVERADLLDVLARCYRELARWQGREDPQSDAVRTARAALRELARCVLVADGTERALEVAARANETVARTVGWCLTDGRHRAAVEVAEAGRSLVLASLVLAGRVEQVLRSAEKHDVADAWRNENEEGRLAGLNVLWDTGQSGTLLATPTAEEIPIMLAGTAFDAVVYLVPPAPPDGMESDATRPPDALPGHALVVRPDFSSQIEMLKLPGLVTGTGTPLEGYLAALDAALKTHDPAARPLEGFRGTPQGQAWMNALEKLGSWAYAHILSPLIEYTRSWSLGREPRLALISFGDLSAIPYAAAWTDDPTLPGDRRYAIHDIVLTQTVSARMLAEVARRPRQQLTERVVLITDPTGEFPYARATAKALAERQYPRAEVYGRKSAPNGSATTTALLTALPRQDKPGASLLHLSTHATTMPTARLQTADGWLPLTRILEQARNRPPDSAGGLVIANACLTDSTRTHHDESLTLAAALLAAGATAVIGTRWPIDDDTTSVLTYRLHYHLQMGHPPAEALRLAQLDLLTPGPKMRLGLHPHLAALSNSRLTHPASWAGYVHHGI